MLMPDYHTMHAQAQERLRRCQREAASAQEDTRYLRQMIAHWLRRLADNLEPHALLKAEIYAHE